MRFIGIESLNRLQRVTRGLAATCAEMRLQWDAGCERRRRRYPLLAQRLSRQSVRCTPDELREIVRWHTGKPPLDYWPNELEVLELRKDWEKSRQKVLDVVPRRRARL